MNPSEHAEATKNKYQKLDVCPKQKMKAFWIPFELNTFCENVANSICEILAPEPADRKSVV